MTNPIPPVRVDIVEGENTAVPGLKRTGEEIARVAAGATGGLSPIQKLSKAMVLAEGREGSLVLRELRGAVTGLGAEALGASGPLGRLGVTLAEFGIGGGVGLAAVAGIAAIGYAWKKSDEAAQLAADNAVAVTERLKRVFASVMKEHGDDPAAGLNLLRRAADDAKAALTALAAAPLPEQRFRREFSAATGATVSVPINNPVQQRADEIAAADDKARIAQQALNDATKAANDAGDKATDVLKRQGNAMEATNAIRAQAIVSGQNESDMLVDLAGATARETAAVMGLDDKHTAALVTQTRRIERIKLETQALEEQQNVLEEITRIGAEVSDFMVGHTGVDRDSGVRFTIGGEGAAALAGIKTPTFEQLQAAEAARQASLQVSKIEKQGGEFAFGLDQKFFDGIQHSVSEALATTPGQNKPDITRLSAEGLAALAAVKSGNTGATLGGFGSLASSLSLDKAHGGLGLTALGPIGTGLQIAGGFVSLFDHSAERRHKEMLAALKRIEEKGVAAPTRVQPIFVGATPANAADVAYQVGRLQDRDAVPRGVGNS
jgi:hypothetical protein